MPVRINPNSPEINKITLNPELDIHATIFEAKNLIHLLEYHQVIKIIEKLKNAESNYNPNKKENLKRYHNTITLSGSRGSGKTSFLLSLREDFKDSEDVLFIEIIDPTLIEEKGHIFLNIVTRVKSLIDDQKLDYNDEKYLKWNETLKKLATGLPMLDGINGGLDPSDWNDTTFVMMDGLKRVEGANNLEWYFHQYIYMSLQILDKKYLMIAFDDVDTDFSKGWPVLEVLRKYLTSPQIITFLSGDLDLYSFLVRKKQWKNFGKTLLKNEYDKDDTNKIIYSNEYPELVEKLESQYMMKLLKPEYRITLSTISSKLKSKKIKIFLENLGGLWEIEAFYSNYLTRIWGINGNNIQVSYMNFFTSLPLRSQLSLINSLKKIDNEDISRSERLTEITKGITDIFLSELRTANVDVWEMVNGYGLTNIYMLNFLLDNRILDEASQFYPKLNAPSLDGAVTAMGIVLSERLTLNPYEVFDYITRVSNIVAKANKWGVEKSTTTQSIKDLVEHSRSLYDYGLKKIASLQSAYIVSFEDKYEAKTEGLIPIKSLQEFNKGRRNEEDLRIDELFNNSYPTEQILALLPSFGAQDNLGNNVTFYSFYNIIGAIGDILYQNDNEVQNEFIRVGQFREFPIFKNSNERYFSDITNTQPEGNSYHSETTSASVTPFTNEIIEWKKKWDDSPVNMPPYILGRIMVRTVFSFTQINYQATVGDMLHRQIIVFLNAILVEEVMENKGNDKLRLVNPSNSDDYFIENIKKTKSKVDEKSTHPFFDFVFSCPIIQAYLNPNIFNQIEASVRVLDVNIFLQLVEIKIKDSVKQDNTPKTNITFDKLDRNAKDTNEDAERIIEYLTTKGKRKETIVYQDIDNAIRRLFNNKQVKKVTANRLLDKIRNSNIW